MQTLVNVSYRTEWHESKRRGKTMGSPSWLHWCRASIKLRLKAVSKLLHGQFHFCFLTNLSNRTHPMMPASCIVLTVSEHSLLPPRRRVEIHEQSDLTNWLSPAASHRGPPNNWNVCPMLFFHRLSYDTVRSRSFLFNLATIFRDETVFSLPERFDVVTGSANLLLAFVDGTKIRCIVFAGEINFEKNRRGSFEGSRFLKRGRGQAFACRSISTPPLTSPW